MSFTTEIRPPGPPLQPGRGPNPNPNGKAKPGKRRKGPRKDKREPRKDVPSPPGKEAPESSPTSDPDAPLDPASDSNSKQDAPPSDESGRHVDIRV